MVRKLQDNSKATREEWLQTRKKGIGGSDVAALVGLNPFKSVLNVYLDKTSDEIREISDNEKMRVGRDLEDYVAKRFEEATGKKVRRNNFTLQHDTKDFLIANVDREVVGENAVLECKTTSSFNRKTWEEGIPPYYELQVLHYMLVGGYEKGYIAVLIGNEKFIWHEVKRDEEMIKHLEEIETKFWLDHVEKNVIPEPDGSDDYDNEIKNKYKYSNEESIDITGKNEALERIDELKDMERDIQTKIKKLEQEIKLELGDNEVGLTDRFKVTWKSSTRSSLDTKKLKEEQKEIYDNYLKTTETRTFRITKIGE